MIKTISKPVCVFILIFFSIPLGPDKGNGETMTKTPPGVIIKLPRANLDGPVSVEQALQRRRSIRNYAKTPVSLNEVAQLLWAAQGITTGRRFRTAPSAGALYPLEIYLVSGNVVDLPTGIYIYRPHVHDLILMVEDDHRRDLKRAALHQGAIGRAAADIVICAVFERVTGKYGERGIRYVFMEAGHAAQNIALQATALDLGTVPIGAFDDHRVARILQAEKNEQVIYILPVGKQMENK